MRDASTLRSHSATGSSPSMDPASAASSAMYASCASRSMAYATSGSRSADAAKKRSSTSRGHAICSSKNPLLRGSLSARATRPIRSRARPASSMRGS